MVDEIVDGQNDSEYKIPAQLQELYISVSPTNNVRLEQKADAINSAFFGLWQLHAWAISYTDDEDTDSVKLGEEGEYAYQLLSLIKRLCTEAPQPALQAQIEKNIGRLTIPSSEDRPPVEFLTIQHEKELTTISWKVSGSTHYLKHFLTLIRDSLSHDSEKFDTPQEYLRAFADALAGTRDNILDMYPRKSEYASIIIERLYWLDDQLSRMGIKLLQGSKDPSDKGPQVVWPFYWFDIVCLDIVQNVGRAYAEEKGKHKILSVHYENSVTSNGTPAIDFIFEDNGPGFPDDIIENGFIEGFSHWPNAKIQGTGTGMAYDTIIFRENYGGDIIPAKRLDAKGRPIPGARLIVRLPLVQGN